MGAGAAALTVSWLPEIARRVAIARIQTATHRPVSIDAVELSLLNSRISIRGLRIVERDGTTPFADVERLDVSLNAWALLRGHLWIRDLVLDGSTVRVVRLPHGTFNFSDLIGDSAATERVFDVTVDRFAVQRGTITLDDRALPEAHTWASEQITIEARNLSTRRNDGTARGSSVTAGAPLSLEIADLRLYPIHLRAVVTLGAADLTPLRVYIPPDAPVTLVRGRASTSANVLLDARAGLRADIRARVEDVVLGPPAGGEPLAMVPRLDIDVSGLGVRDGELELTRLATQGAVQVREPGAAAAARYPTSSVRATVADLTWPARTEGRLDAAATVPGGGAVSLAGIVRPPPAITELTMRLASVNLAPWGQFLPLAAQVRGRAEANLSIKEPLGAGIPTRIQGLVAIDQLAVVDSRQEVAGASRIEARELQLQWPARLVVGRLSLTGPRGFIERDQAGNVPITGLISPSRPGAVVVDDGGQRAAGKLAVEVREVVVRGGRVTWRDATRSPTPLLVTSAIDATVTNAGWPPRGPLGVRASLRPPGGGFVSLSGHVAVEPVSAELRVVAKDADLSPYQTYVPTAALVSGSADLDATLLLPPIAERRAVLRGTVGLSHVDVRDAERTVARVERATATGVDVDWPSRIAVQKLALGRPWLLLERDNTGSLALRRLLASRPRPTDASPASDDAAAAPLPAISIGRIAVDDGGLRVVDRAVSPPFAIDLQPARAQLEGLSTEDVKPARLDLRASVGPSAELILRGTLGRLGGPLSFDASGELREFAVPRTNPYLVQHVGWRTTEGRLTTKVQCRIDGDALSAKTDVRLSRLALVRASAPDEAQKRVGLPLGLLTALLKDRRGDISLSFPVSGRLSDPRFDFRDTVWSAIRTVAVHAITLPVSWIGRVRFTPDSKIERIEVEPIPFVPGTATLTPDGEARTSRLTAFLDQLPAVRLALSATPSSRDIEELRRRPLETAIDRAMRRGQLSRPEAIARLHAEQLPGQPVPERPEAAFTALLEARTLPASQVPDLVAARLVAVRDAAKRAGIDPARLPDSSATRRPGAVDSQVELEVVQPEASKTSGITEILRRLGISPRTAEPDR